MVICMNCEKEMKCSRNGVVAVWRGSHCYSGDEYKCPLCESKTLIIVRTPYHQEDALMLFKRISIPYINMSKEDEA